MEDVHRLLNLGVVPRLLVKDESAVADHPHLAEHEQQPSPVGLADEMHSLPLVHNLGDGGLPLIVHLPLLRGHGHEKQFVGACRHLKRDIRLAAAYEAGADLLRDHIQIAVGQHLAGVIPDSGLFHELVVRAEAVLIHQLHH